MMVTTEARAKINLSLGILGKREDGYHEIETIMQSVSLSDTISVSRRDGGISLTVSPPVVPADESNLAWKAAAFFLRERKISDGVDIKIEKRIPVAAGLAGGSADAAGALVAMNRLFGSELPYDELSSMGAEIGSDVLFCVLGGTMLATGRGETLIPLPCLGRCHIVLAKPPVSVSTPWAYAEYDRSRDGRALHSRGLMDALAAGDFPGAMRNCFNALESVVARRYPEIRDYEEIFYDSGADLAMMSGSGPTVFAIFRESETAIAAASRMRKAYPTADVFVTESAERNLDT